MSILRINMIRLSSLAKSSLWAGLAMLATIPASAQEPKPVGTFNDWVTYTYKNSKGTVCLIASQPKSAKLSREGAKRGDVHFMVNYRPSENVNGEVQIFIGYKLKEESTVDVTIDGQKFALIPVGENAWADGAMNGKIVSAMKAGSSMTVSGESWRGTKSTDRYSLSGVTAALGKATSLCK